MCMPATPLRENAAGRRRGRRGAAVSGVAAARQQQRAESEVKWQSVKMKLWRVMLPECAVIVPAGAYGVLK